MPNNPTRVHPASSGSWIVKLAEFDFVEASGLDLPCLYRQGLWTAAVYSGVPVSGFFVVNCCILNHAHRLSLGRLYDRLAMDMARFKIMFLSIQQF